MAEPDPKKAKQDWPADCLRRAAEQCLAEDCRNVQVLVLDASRTDTLLGEFTFNFESDDAEVFLGWLTGLAVQRRRLRSTRESTLSAIQALLDASSLR